MSDPTRRARLSPRILSCAALAVALTYACGGGDSPTQPQKPAVDRTPIKVVAGSGQTDTIGATLPQALVVEIRDTSGKLFSGATARFTSLGGPALLQVSPIGAQAFAVFASDVADAQGRAKTLLQLGTSASAVKLEIAVPELGAADTISFTVKPGLPAKFSISPRDTTILPGGSYTLTVQTTDRASNPITSATPTFAATGVTITPAGVVTAGTNGVVRARIGITYQSLTDNAGLWVVPKLPMVMNKNQSVVLVNSDGSGAATLASSSDFSLSPSSVAATPKVVYYQGDPAYSGTIWVVQPNGAPQRLNPASAPGEGWARLSKDGTWVYFTREYKSLWRVKLDGTGLDSLTSFAPVRVYIAPSVSSDGGSVAVEDGSGVKIFDVTTRTPRTMATSCGAPTYSPDGSSFSCTSGNIISVVKTDGTGMRQVADMSSYGGLDGLAGAEWTPDGNALLVTLGYGQGAVLVDVATGSVLRLTGLGLGFLQASLVR